MSSFITKLRAYADILIILPILAMVMVPQEVLFPHTNGKTLIFVTLTAITLKIWLLLKEKIQIPKNALSVVLVLFILSMGISSITSIDVMQSVWGSDVRGFGLWVWVWLVMFYVWCANIMQSPCMQRAVLWTVIVVGDLSFIKVVSELVNNGVHRVESVFGNPLLYANVALFPLFFSLDRAYKEKDIRLKMVAGISAVLSLVGIYFTQTRGVLIGLLAAAVVVTVVIMRPRSKKQKKFVMVGGLLLVLLFAGLWTQRNTRTIKYIPALDRLLHISPFETSANQRILLWKSALKASWEKPLLGWGPENYDYALDRHFDPTLIKFGFSQTFSDRAHNMYLDVLVMQGVIGLLILVLLGLTASRCLYTQFKTDRTRTLILLGLMTAYAVQAFFSFDSPATTIGLMITLAYIGSLSKVTWITLRHKKVILAVVAILSITTLIVVGIAYRSSRALVVIEQATHIDQPEVSLGEGELGRWSPHRHSLAQRYANLMFERASRDDISNAALLLQSGMNQMKAGIQRHPERFPYYFTLGNILTKASFILDPSFAAEADQTLLHAISIAPDRLNVQFQRANLRIVTKQYDEAAVILDNIISRAPDVQQAHYLKGLILTYTQEQAEGLDEIYIAFTDKPAYMPDSKIELEHLTRVAIENRRHDVASFTVMQMLHTNVFDDDQWSNLYQLLTLEGIETDFIKRILNEIYLHKGYNDDPRTPEIRARAKAVLDALN